jgi:predicted ATPase
LHTAEHQPVLLVVEDLHWVDPSTLELLGLLIPQVPTARIGILGTCRPEFAMPWPQRAHITQVPLGRLLPSQITQMVLGVTGGRVLPDKVVEQVVRTSDGVPLFVEELTKAVLGADRFPGPGASDLETACLPHLSIPATLQESLMARLDRLGTAKPVAQLGATLGRQFSYTLFRAVAPWDDAELHTALARLVDAELLYQRGVPPQATYRFKHALIQEAAYQSLLRSTRRQYHQQIGEAILVQHGDDLEEWVSVLAHHFVQSSDVTKALPYLVQTGERAQRVYANAEAVQAFAQALALLDALPVTDVTQHQRLDLLQQLASLHALLGHYSESLVGYARALEGAEAQGDTKAIAQLKTRIGRVHYTMGDYEGAIACFQNALELAQHIHDRTRMAVCYQSLGDVYFSSGSLPQAIACYMSALSLSEEENNQAGVAAVCTFLSNAHNRAGNLAAGAQWGRRALALGEQLHDDRRVAWACLMLQWSYRLTGEFAEAYALLERALQLCEKVGDYRGSAWANVLYGRLRAAADKDYEGACTSMQAMVHMGTASGGFQHEVSYAFARAAEALLRLGRYREAFEYCHQGLAIALKVSNKLEYGYGYMVLAEIHASEIYNDWDKSSLYLEESFKAFREVGSQIDVGRAHLAGARIALRRQDASARQWTETAKSIFAERGAKALQKEAEELLAALA